MIFHNLIQKNQCLPQFGVVTPSEVLAIPNYFADHARDFSANLYIPGILEFLV
jgi:hypothetical protein